MTRIDIIGVAAGATLALGAATLHQPLSAQATKSQWDGVYTVEQAARGETLYAEQCASCHGQGLNGGEMAPGLVGGEFSANWNDLSLGDLFDRTRISMPADNPGSLSRSETADIIAFMLARGNYPAGQAELSSQIAELRQIQFLALNPNGQ